MISLDHSNIGQPDIDSVLSCLRAGQVSTAAPVVAEFEKRMAEWLGVPDCVATNSGTAALHLALMECGVGPGDEVIIPALTYVATRNVLQYIGARPQVRDVDSETWLLLEDKRYGYARIPVDLYGNVFMGKGAIFDAAESLGSKPPHDNKDMICYSFNGNKLMTTGGGGLIVGPDLDSIRAKLNPGHYDGVGYNYRMPSLNAALGLGQLERLDSFLEKKRRFNGIYRHELNKFVKFQVPMPGSEPSWWMTACLFDRPAEIMQQILAQKSIPTRRIFEPLADRETCPNAWHIYDQGLCLPSGTLMEDEDVLQVCRVIRGIL